jgi:uncharacterized membrane protein HdeD (DUF308 family)
MTQASEDISNVIDNYRGWFIALGIVLILIGTGAIVFPLVSTLSTGLFVGWVLVIGGIAQIVHAFWAKEWSGFFWQLLIGIVELVAGFALLAFPIAGIIALTAFMAITFVVEGVLKVVMAFNIKPQTGWIWVLLSGVLSFVVGAMLWAKLPSSALWAIGLLVGLNIAMAGWSLLMMAWLGNKEPSATSTT